MIFRYGAPADHSAGGFSLALNEVSVNTIKRARKYNQRGGRFSTLVTMHVTGRLKYTGVDAITAAINAFEAGLLSDLTGTEVAGLYKDDGVTPTAHLISADQTINGIRPSLIQYDQRTGGAEYSSGRSISFVLQTEYIQSGLGGSLLFWKESIRTIGTGGTKSRYVEQVTGAPIKNVLAANSIQHIFQQGIAIGYSGYVIVPNPIYLGDLNGELEDEREVTYVTPEAGANAYIEYVSRWGYHMVKAGVSPPVPATV